MDTNGTDLGIGSTCCRKEGPGLILLSTRLQKRLNIPATAWSRRIRALPTASSLQSAVLSRGRIMLDRWSSLAAGVSLIARAAAKMAAGRNW